MTEQKFVVVPNEVETIMADWVTAKVIGGPGVSPARAMSAVIGTASPRALRLSA